MRVANEFPAFPVANVRRYAGRDQFADAFQPRGGLSLQDELPPCLTRT